VATSTCFPFAPLFFFVCTFLSEDSSFPAAFFGFVSTLTGACLIDNLPGLLLGSSSPAPNAELTFLWGTQAARWTCTRSVERSLEAGLPGHGCSCCCWSSYRLVLVLFVFLCVFWFVFILFPFCYSDWVTSTTLFTQITSPVSTQTDLYRQTHPGCLFRRGKWLLDYFVSCSIRTYTGNNPLNAYGIDLGLHIWLNT